MFTIVSEETYSDGQIILREGTPGDWVYVILSGKVRIIKSVKGKSFILAVLEPGEVFGELSFLGGINRTATAQAVGETTLGIVDRDSLDAEFNKISSDFRYLIVSSVRRFQKMLDRACEFSTRASPRIQKTVSLAYKDKESFVKAYASNISAGGLFIKTENPLKKGESFLLKLGLPDISEPLKIGCEVMWSRPKEEATERRPPGMGIKFKTMSESDRRALNSFLSDLQNP
ncbi:MAG: TIGR02266 family protein [Deltaproteobacteria bacterium]|nr:TIGR02266 family protein [Deltaproteobacteria bacterium]